MKALSFLVRNPILSYHKVFTFSSVYTKCEVESYYSARTYCDWTVAASRASSPQEANPLEIDFNKQVEMLSSM